MRTPAHVPLLHMFKIRAFECPLASLANSGALVAMGAMAIENGFCGFFRAEHNLSDHGVADVLSDLILQQTRTLAHGSSCRNQLFTPIVTTALGGGEGGRGKQALRRVTSKAPSVPTQRRCTSEVM